MNVADLKESGRSAEHNVVVIDQKCETPLDSVHTPYAEVSYLYARSEESQSSGIEGQDYLAFQHNETVISFVVCDGVGQSFCGHLAAKLLGDSLVEWLSQVGDIVDGNDLGIRVTQFLNELSGAGQQMVLEYPLPKDLTPLVRAALEEQRSYGSETMFVGGRLQFAGDSTNSPASGELLLCWLGDAEVQVFDSKNYITDVGASWHTRERWSTTKGVKGADQVHVWISELANVSRIIAYSDGLSCISDRLYELASMPKALQQEIKRIYDTPESDDISLIDIRLKSLARECQDLGRAEKRTEIGNQ